MSEPRKNSSPPFSLRSLRPLAAEKRNPRSSFSIIRAVSQKGQLLLFESSLFSQAVVDNLTRTSAFLANRDARQKELQHRLAETFGSASALTLEIGSGHGHFLTAFAAAHPTRLCVGIDIMRDRVGRAGKKRTRARLENLFFLHAEAREFLAALPPAARLEDVFILFPDPWPKRRHHKNRLLQPDFLSSLAERAGEGTRLFFRTDFAPYFAEASAAIDAHPSWKRDSESPWPFELETVFQSRAKAYESLIARKK